MMMRHAIALTALLVAGLAAPAAAQDKDAWPARVYVTADAPFQLLNNDFSETVTLTDAIVRGERDTFSAAYGSTRGATFDLGIGTHLTGAFGAGVTGSWFGRTADAALNLSVPSPAAANRARTLSATASGLHHREVGI